MLKEMNSCWSMESCRFLHRGTGQGSFLIKFTTMKKSYINVTLPIYPRARGQIKRSEQISVLFRYAGSKTVGEKFVYDLAVIRCGKGCLEPAVHLLEAGTQCTLDG